MSWILILPLLALLVYWGDGKHVSPKGTISIRIFIILITSVYSVSFCGLATDHVSYVTRYNTIHSSDFQDFLRYLIFFSSSGKSIEPGFGLVNLAGNLLGLGELGFFFFLALFINAVVINYLYKYPMPVLSYMFLTSMQFFLIENNLLRQMLAMCILLLFFKYLENRSWWKYCIGVLLASTFHTSAFIFILFLPLCFVREKSYNTILGISVLVWMFSLTVALGLISYNPLNFLAEVDYYSTYADVTNSVGTSTSFQRALMFDIVSILIFCLTFKNNIVFSLLVISSSIVMNFSFNNPNIARLYFYFAVVDYVYVSYLLSNEADVSGKQKSLITIGKVVFVSYCVFRLFDTYVLGDDLLDMPVTYSWSQFFK